MYAKAVKTGFVRKEQKQAVHDVSPYPLGMPQESLIA